MKKIFSSLAITLLLLGAAPGCDDDVEPWKIQDAVGDDAVESGDPVGDDVIDVRPEAPPDPSIDETVGEPDVGPDVGPDVAEEETPPGDCGWVRIVDLGGEPLNVRDAPSLSGAVIGQISEGALARVLGTATGDLVTDASLGRSSDLWYNIAYGGGDGWITSVYAQCCEEPDPGDALNWVWPVTGGESLDPWDIICQFGCSWSTYLGHLAEDYSMYDDIGKPIFAAADGVVAHVYHDVGNYMDIIIVRHDLPVPTSAGDSVLFARYGHTGAEVNAGDLVTAGQRVGTIVDTGVFVQHLHFEIVNESAQYNGPFCNGCEAAGYFMGPGYANYDFDGTAIDFLDPSGDGIDGNRFYKPSRVITTDGRL